MTVSIAKADMVADATRIAVLRYGGEYQLLLTRHVCAGERLFRISGSITQVPTRYSVQIGLNSHIDLPTDHQHDEILDRFFWRFMNHSCDPNSVIRGREVFARTCIDAWNEVRFDYNTTEYDMAEPFDCRCGSPSCAGQVRGFKWLTRQRQEALRPWLADHLLARLDRAEAPAVAGQVRA